MSNDEQYLASTHPDAAKGFWNRLSAYYVRVTRLDDLRARTTTEVLMREAEVGDGDLVLDAGCGHLRVTLGMLRMKPSVTVVGLDLTRGLLLHGRGRCVQTGVAVPGLSCGDVHQLPFAGESFDAGVCARVFQYVNDPVKALKEAYRVLRPGARFALSVPNRYNPLKRLRYSGRLYAPIDLGRWLQAAGFTEIRTGSMCFVPGLFRRGWDSSWIHFERLARMPGVGLVGGNAVASGRRPR